MSNLRLMADIHFYNVAESQETFIPEIDPTGFVIQFRE